MPSVNVPEFDLNDPFTLNTEETAAEGEKKQDLLNRMWRNPCLNDTYEPGSTFKIITMAAGLEEGVVSTEDRFFSVRAIRWWRTGGSTVQREQDMVRRVL